MADYQNNITPRAVSTTTPVVMEPKKSLARRLYQGAGGVVIGALIGTGVGIGLQQSSVSDEFVSWIELPGDLFIRALKCLVSPLVFASLITGMADMLNVGKASSIGWRTAVAYTLTTILASIEGLILVILFRPLFSSKEGKDDTKPTNLAFMCDGGRYMTVDSNDSSIKCIDSEITNSSTFLTKDVNSVFQLKTEKFAKLTLSESLQAQLKQMVPDNITKAFAEANLLSIVMFALPLGIAIALLPSTRTGENRLLHLFREINLVLMAMIKGAIFLTPIAVIFLIAGALAKQDDLFGLLKDVGTLILTVFIGLIIHVFFTLPGLLAAVTKINPFRYLQHMFPAQIFALGCASSMATLPVTMKCVDASRQVSTTLSRFVLSLGATINMDGSALYYPAAIVFMAETSGLGDKVGGVEMFLIIIVSTIGAVGSAPVPSAGIVMTITIWNSVFPSIPLPKSFSYIVATDWLTDRFITATNVTGDTVISRIIAHLVDETTVEEERESLNSIYDEGYLLDKPELKSELEHEEARASATKMKTSSQA